MADSDDILGLTRPQHRAVGRLVAQARRPVRPAVGVTRERTTVQPLVRVMAPASRSYDSRTETACVVFTRDPGRTILTVEFVGSTLSGYLTLTINGAEFIVECRRQTLEDIVLAVPILLRATVLPGVWELDFGLTPEDELTVTAAAVSGQTEINLCALLNSEDCAFSGSAVVRPEAWHTLPDGDGQPETIDVVDAIPYANGAIGPGAVGTACWSWDAGYVVSGWQCRQFSFASGYDPDTDLVDPVTGEESETPVGGGSGGGSGGPGSEEPPE